MNEEGKKEQVRNRRRVSRVAQEYKYGGGSKLSPKVPLPEGQMFMYANNDQSGNCCTSSNVSGPGGCVCITKEQQDYLNSRGGNRANVSEY